MWPVNSYLAASSSTWYLSPSRSTSCTSCAGERRFGRRRRRYQSRSSRESARRATALVEALRGAWRAASLRRPRSLDRLSRASFTDLARSRTSPGSSACVLRSIARSASRLGPRPAIWLGSRRIGAGQLLVGQLAHARRTSACARRPARPDPAAAASGWESSSGRTSGRCG